MENWDDDDLDIGADELTTFRASVGTATTTRGHRDSISSKISTASDFFEANEPKQLHLPGDDEKSTTAAIAAAAKAGIPIPANVPSSALTGGTIKRLGTKKVRRVIQDDWDEDLELPGEGGLKIKQQEASNFPDVLRQVSGGSVSPEKSPRKLLDSAPIFTIPDRLKTSPSTVNLDRFKDEQDEDDVFGDGMATIRPSKTQPQRGLQLITPPTKKLEFDDFDEADFDGPSTIKASKLQTVKRPTITPPTPQNNDMADDDFEADLELPADGEPLRLSARKDIPKTPLSAHDDFDWGEGSLGTRFGGTRRCTSNRSSSVSALSPSVGSSYTAESEDEALDGLVLPDGPLRFGEMIKKRANSSPEQHPKNGNSGQPSSADHVSDDVSDDFTADLEFEEDKIFNTKAAQNRNIKIKTTHQSSPARPKTTVAVTFSNKPTTAASSRSTRPRAAHERASVSLEPVMESGEPISQTARRSQPRMARLSITNLPTPTAPSTPSRRLGQKQSADALRTEPTTTNAQLLRVKRSMPNIRGQGQSPVKPIGSRFERPTSHSDNNKPNTMFRPRTPAEKEQDAESSGLNSRKPFLPAGPNNSVSHHRAIKPTRSFSRHESNSSSTAELRPQSRAVSSSTWRSPHTSPNRSPSPRKRGADALAREAALQQQMTKPLRSKAFGDGSELDTLDDLPVSRGVESKYEKKPAGRGAPKSVLQKKFGGTSMQERTSTPMPLTPTLPFSPSKGNLPRFARDTAASRMAREQVLAQRAPAVNTRPAAPAMTSQWKAHVSAKSGLNPANTKPIRTKKSRPPPQRKPHLITSMGDAAANPKCESLA